MLPSHCRVKFSYWAIFVMLMASSEVYCQRRPLIPMSVLSRDPDQLLARSESTPWKREPLLTKDVLPRTPAYQPSPALTYCISWRRWWSNLNLREETISLVRRRICGEKFQRLVCFPASFLGHFHSIIHIKGALKTLYLCMMGFSIQVETHLPWAIPPCWTGSWPMMDLGLMPSFSQVKCRTKSDYNSRGIFRSSWQWT